MTKQESTVQVNRDNYMQLLGYWTAKGNQVQIKFYKDMIAMCDKKLESIRKK